MIKLRDFPNSSGVYKIENTLTGDFYIGSSKNVKKRWAYHKCPSTWNRYSKRPLYSDMKKYGVDKFDFQILAEVGIEQLKETEQEYIEMFKPTYNNYNANGINIERCKEYQKEYRKSDKRKEYQKEYQKEYRKSDKYKEYQEEYHKEYRKSDKYKEYQKEYNKEYKNQLCSYNGVTISLGALAMRFQRAGIEHPTLEAKKYLIKN